jgi:hypothetical protein
MAINQKSKQLQKFFKFFATIKSNHKREEEKKKKPSNKQTQNALVIKSGTKPQVPQLNINHIILLSIQYPRVLKPTCTVSRQMRKKKNTNKPAQTTANITR